MQHRAIKTVAPRKGDLVPGHKVYAFMPDNLPAVPGRIVAVSASGHSVTVEVDPILSVLGLPRRTEWTWRKSVDAYQHSCAKTSPGWGLARMAK